MMHKFHRREFLAAAALAALGRHAGGQENRLRGEVGITVSSLSGHLAARPGKGQFSLLELPRILRDELDMRIIDLNTSMLFSEERPYLESVRNAAARAGCILTNLKMNQPKLDLSSDDRNERDNALAVYRRSIDAAAALGVRWVRPLPPPRLRSMEHYVAGYRVLADYARERHLQMLVENFGWMEGDAESVPRLIKAVGRNTAACPDTGNWSSNEVRYEGLRRVFPLALTCDFKARELGPDGEHKLYDLERCFRIGWQAGFRGPWCLEHANRDRQTLFRELRLLRDMIRRWSK